MLRKIGKDDVVYFYHNYVTGGLSIVYILEDLFSFEETCHHYFPEDFKAENEEHYKKLKFFRGHLDNSIYRYITPSVFLTMVRNPINQFISNFYIKKHELHQDKNWYKRIEKITLEDFLKDKPCPYEELPNYQTIRFAIESKDPIDIGTCSNKQLLKIAKSNLEKYQFVGLTEQFVLSTLLLSYELGFPPLVPELKLWLNKESKTKQAQLSNEVKEKIQEVMRLDMELYEFAKKIFENKCSLMAKDLFLRFGNRFNFLQSELLFDLDLLQKVLIIDHVEDLKNKELIDKEIFYDAKKSVATKGFQFKEKSDSTNRIIRWSGGEIESSIFLLFDRSKENRILFSVNNTLQKENLCAFQVFVDDKEIPLNVVWGDLKTGAMPVVFEGIIPQTTGALNFTEIMFKINSTVSPKELGLNQDTRSLGVLIGWVNIFPISAPVKLCFSNALWSDGIHPVLPIVDENDIFWTGPKTIASFGFPALGSKEFIVDLDIKDVGSLDLWNNIKIFFNRNILKTDVQKYEQGRHIRSYISVENRIDLRGGIIVGVQAGKENDGYEKRLLINDLTLSYLDRSH